ncbi:ABC transporter permease [Alkalicoccobacillus murimartini]|uniref:Iron(III) transport system permease protein n=1 Tax=Alkalicoccobacillus murimartini TaxID=171685 RepID=A0ABT9YK36_9BACI|nr:iron ABC transporter permease [Alkalicoccobacillus murimartini]MDQ0207389.1 iron(III) transport system permease protein [Alkalicoccobacillus murimartini]
MRSISRYHSRSRVVNKLIRILTNPIHLISALALLFLTYMVAFPIGQILIESFQEDARSGGAAGSFTVANWMNVFAGSISEPLFYKPLLHSLSIGLSVSVLSFLLGGGLAWLVMRTDFRYKKSVTMLALLPYMLPSWVMAFAWMSVFKNDRIGGGQGLFYSVFQVSPPDWLAYGFVPIVLTMTLNYFTFFFLLLSVALGAVNASLEESARILGASSARTIRKITLPLIIPAISSAFILTFSKALGSFSVPAFLGLPTKYYTIATMLHSSIQNRMISEAYVLCIVLLMVCALLIFFNQKAIGKRRSFATITGKDSRKHLYPLKKWHRPITWSVLGGMGAVSAVPLIILTLQSFMMTNSQFSLDQFTLHFWLGDSNPAIASGEVGVLKNDALFSAIGNSLKIAFTAASIAAIMGLVFGYIVSKRRNRLDGRAIEQLSYLPYLIPGIAFSAIYLSMFATPSWFMPSLYGTITLIILICVVNELPIATRSGASTMHQIGGELEEAAYVQGANWGRRFTRIMLPLSKKTLFTIFLLLFISVIKELDLIILLITPENGTLPTLMFKYAESGFQQYANALMLIIVGIILITYFIASKLGKIDFTKGIGG